MEYQDESFPGFPKPERVHSPQNIEDVRAIGYCQVCGTHKGLEVHHIKTRGSGGGDEPENLVLLCHMHHQLVQEGHLRLEDCDLMRGNVPAFEELIQRAVECCEAEQAYQWTLGAVAAVATGILHVPQGEIASTLGMSSARVGQLIQTWRAFPTDNMRIPELSWQHHQVAAKSTRPGHWIGAAVDNGWSVAELRAAIRAAEEGKPSEQEALRVRANRAIRLVKEILTQGDAQMKAWLRMELDRITV